VSIAPKGTEKVVRRCVKRQAYFFFPCVARFGHERMKDCRVKLQHLQTPSPLHMKRAPFVTMSSKVYSGMLTSMAVTYLLTSELLSGCVGIAKAVFRMVDRASEHQGCSREHALGKEKTVTGWRGDPGASQTALGHRGVNGYQGVVQAMQANIADSEPRSPTFCQSYPLFTYIDDSSA
jgi:hypothetical protein